MRKIAILVIAAVNQPVYRHYIKSYWTEVIRYTNACKSNIDVFLLFENGTVIEISDDISNNIIVDEARNMNRLCHPKYFTPHVPGILSKTIFALEKLQDQYDVFFRTNLSSMIKISAFDDYVQSAESVSYSGAWVWADNLRKDLLNHGKIGPDKSIKEISELDEYEGNTFISGSGYFLNSDEAKSLVERKARIRFDIIDDVAVGLMFAEYKMLKQFTTVVTADKSPGEIVELIKASKTCHIRLQWFPARLARAVWFELRDDPVWR